MALPYVEGDYLFTSEGILTKDGKFFDLPYETAGLPKPSAIESLIAVAKEQVKDKGYTVTIRFDSYNGFAPVKVYVEVFDPETGEGRVIASVDVHQLAIAYSRGDGLASFRNMLTGTFK